MERNVAIMKSIVASVKDTGFQGILLVITNPVDVLTWGAFTESGFPASRVIGSGTTLDSARLREYVARHCRINPQNIHGYVLGEHGDTSFPAWSLLTIGVIHFDEFCPVCGSCGESSDFKRNAAEDVRRTDFNGIARTAFSFPTIVGRGGMVQVLDFKLALEEEKLLLASARFVGDNISHAGF